MVLLAGLLIILAFIFGPSLWVKLVMKKYSLEKSEIPGTGGELARHLIKQLSFIKLAGKSLKMSIYTHSE